MRSSIFLVVPFAAVVLGQVSNSGGAVTSQPTLSTSQPTVVTSQPPVVSVINTSLPSVSSPSSTVPILSGATNATDTTGGVKQTDPASTATETQTGNKTNSSSTGASTSTSAGAAAGMMQPVLGLGLAGVIVAAFF